MSLPVFPNLDYLSQDQTINAILTSIAMEEAALSHVINAEGEKIQAVLAHVAASNNRCVDLHRILEVNKSMASLFDQITDLQLILKKKMRIAVDFLPSKPDESCPPPGTDGPCPPQKSKPYFCRKPAPCKPLMDPVQLKNLRGLACRLNQRYHCCSREFVHRCFR